ncbi:MAG: tetratricopeptide repeat protein [Candidatus Dormibacteraceae bacterium]
MSTETQEPSKPKSTYVEDAIQLASDGSWEEAIELNGYILEAFGSDESTHNRLGKAYAELDKLEEAKAAYETAFQVNPLSPVARKNIQKLDGLIRTHQSYRSASVRVDPNLFVEEMGKTTTTTLRGAADDVDQKVGPGDVADVRIEGDGVEVDTARGVRIGSLEPKLARRLFKFIQGGNRYQVGVTSCEGNVVKVIVREVYQDPKFAGKPSFPITRKRDVEFRPYARESLAATGPALSAVDEDDQDLSDALAEDSDAEEGMHEVEDESAEQSFDEDSDEGDES